MIALIAKKEARARGLKRYFDGSACVNGHVDERYTANGICATCARIKCQLRYAADPLKHAADRRRRVAKDREGYLRARNTRRARPPGRATEMLQAARWRAARKGLPFDLTADWLRDRIDAGVCHVTGLPFDMSAPVDGRQAPWSPSIDRINPSLGYTKSNCRVVVWALNCALSHFGEEVLAKVAKAFLCSRGTGLT